MILPAPRRVLAWLVPRLLPALFPLAIVVIGTLLMAVDPHWVQGLRNNLFDQYQRWKPRTYADSPVRIIDIDEDSLARLGQWPWPRTRLAEMVTAMRDGGAAAIGFDVVFAEPDRTSPLSMAGVWLPSHPDAKGERADAASATQLRALLQTLPDHDAVMAEALARGGVVLGYALGPRIDQPLEQRPVLLRPAPYVQKGPPALGAMHLFESVVPPLLPFQRNAAGNGVLTFIPDDDGVVRRVPLVLRFNNDPVPSFSAEMLRVGQGARNTILSSVEGGSSGTASLHEVRIGAVAVPTTAQGEAWVYYSRPEAGRYIPAWKLLAGQVPPDQLKDRLLLVGSSAQGLMDLRFSALGQIIPGVEVHAQALEQMLAGQHLARPAWATAAEILVMLVVGVAVGLLALKAQALLAALLAGLVVASLFSAGWLAFSQYELLLNPLMPSLVVLASFVLCSLVHHFMSERQQRWLTDAFSRYVSPNKVAYLVQHPEGLELGGTRQDCSFIFTDLQGFTGLLENVDPGEAVASLNDYLDGMVGIVFKHEGTLDRIIGDAVAVVFSAPVRQEDYRQRAFDCAMEMHAFSKRYAADLRAKGVQFGNTRIGVHSGEVIVGNFGGSTMFDYRALGDPVNTAARLESVNKHLGTLVCISEAIYLGCADTLARPVGRLVLKGKKQPLMAYEPVVEGDDLTRAPLAEYKAGYAQLAAQRLDGLDPAQTLVLFTELAQRYPKDPLVLLHLGRLQRGESGDEIVMAEK